MFSEGMGLLALAVPSVDLPPASTARAGTGETAKKMDLPPASTARAGTGESAKKMDLPPASTARAGTGESAKKNGGPSAASFASSSAASSFSVTKGSSFSVTKGDHGKEATTAATSFSVLSNQSTVQREDAASTSNSLDQSSEPFLYESSEDYQPANPKTSSTTTKTRMLQFVPFWMLTSSLVLARGGGTFQPLTSCGTLGWWVGAVGTVSFFFPTPYTTGSHRCPGTVRRKSASMYSSLSRYCPS